VGLEQTKGVVNSVDKDSHQLQEFLEQSKDIIISTIQKFPKISETISQLKSKTFGVIIDEVHSSQTGETSKHLKKTIPKGEAGEEDEEELPDYEDLIREEIRNRGRSSRGWFRLVQTGDDKQLPEGKAIRQVVNFVDSHPQTIEQKVKIILQQFVGKTSRTINGKGDKFQTGFDEPLLQAMFIDKKLSGVQCVQTLSRLNRTCAGKTETFVLDFANDTAEVIEAFQPFYTSTELSGETDPNKLYDLETKIRAFNLFSKYMVDEFCRLFYNDRESDEMLQPVLNRVVEKWKDISDPEQKNEFKSLIQSYIRLYGYISQIITFEDIELEKLFIFLKYVNKKLPKGDPGFIDISGSVELSSLRIQKIGEYRLGLEDVSGVLEPITAMGRGGAAEEPLDFLSEIVRKLNEIYGAELTEEHRLDLSNVRTRVQGDEGMRNVMTGDNSETNKRRKFEEVIGSIFLSYVNDRVDFYQKFENPVIRDLIVDEFWRDYLRGVG